MKKSLILILFIILSFLAININVKLLTINDITFYETKNLKNDNNDNGSLKDPEINSPTIQTGELNCETLFLNSDGSEKEFKKILDNIFNLIQIFTPIIALVLTIIDYIKVIASDNNSKKANIRTIKRISIAVIIVFLPLLLDLLFHIFGLYDLSSCNIG